MPDAEKLKTASRILKQYFGHDSFRPGQEELISSLLDGRDALGIMPTGAGKSMCYQIPAIMGDGVTLVVSPLISLMNDQVTALVQSGICGAYYNTSLTENQRRKVCENMLKGIYKIIYVSPERLETESFLRVCCRMNISYVAIDEAHCVSQWGQDFRPSYLKIMSFINQLPKRPVIGAFTATATRKVCDDIVKILELDDPFIITTGFDRPNLYFEVRRPASMRDKFDELLDILDDHEGESGIIYCSTRRAVEEVYEGLCSLRKNVTRYHAGLSAEERKKNQEDFIFDRCPVVVATNAFGMGIDKSNVSFVVHYNMPKNIENYYQEAGRAGRDGEPADCIMLYMAKDIYTVKYFIDKADENEELTPEERKLIQKQDMRRLNKMVDYCNTSGCLRANILRYFGEYSMLECGNCSSCNAAVKRREKREKITFAKAKAALGIQQPGGEKKPAKTPAALSDAKERELFEKLRLARLKQSRIQGVPPYVIFSDRTIIDICKRLPLTREELLAVDGIGNAKADKYGRLIINEVKKFV